MPTTPPTPADLATMSAASLHDLARSLGFSFLRGTSGSDAITVHPPKQPGNNVSQVVALSRRLREPSLATALRIAVDAAGVQPSALRSASASSPKKIGVNPLTGERMPDVEIDLPPPEPTPPPARNSILVDPSAISTLAEANQAIFDLEQGLSVLQWSIDRLPAPHEDEKFETQAKRESLLRQQFRLADHRDLLVERRSELLMRRVDAAALERAQAAPPKCVVRW